MGRTSEARSLAIEARSSLAIRDCREGSCGRIKQVRCGSNEYIHLMSGERTGRGAELTPGAEGAAAWRPGRSTPAVQGGCPHRIHGQRTP